MDWQAECQEWVEMQQELWQESALIPLVGNNSRFQLIIQMQMPIFIHFMRRLITSLFAFLVIHIPIIYLQ